MMTGYRLVLHLKFNEVKQGILKTIKNNMAYQNEKMHFNSSN